MGSLEDLRNKADSGTFWKPEVGQEVVALIKGVVEIGMGASWDVQDLVSGTELYIPQYGNLKKKDLKEGKYYYIRCTRKSVLTQGLGKGKESRIFYVEEFNEEGAQKVANQIKEEDAIKF